MSRVFIFFILVSFLSGCQGFTYQRTYPSGRGVYHTVKKGRTLYTIAKTYGIPVDTLNRLNQVGDPSNLQVGQRLWIPGATQVRYVPPTDKRTRAAKKRNPKKTKKYKGSLSWPVKGVLTSRFGNRNGRHHDGIDIGARKGAPIVAAAPGKVVFSGWGPTGYGLMVIIKHPNHLTTVYAHNSRNHVKKNTRVKKGQRIASVGTTGRSTGPHLHFEVRNDTHPRNPLNYLPH